MHWSSTLAWSLALLGIRVHASAIITPNFARDTAPDVFDGQYLPLNSSNTNFTEWWWVQAITDPVGNNPPSSFQVLFNEGYAFQIGSRDPSLPEFYIDIKGFFPNGTPIATVIPASTVNVTAEGQKVTGIWGDVGHFVGSSDLTTFTATFTAPEFGVTGTMKLTSNGNHHFGCNTTSDPYFTSVVPAGASLSPAEDLLFKHVGWATTIPGGKSEVDLTINSSKLQFTGDGYHDANWSPQPINAAVNTWFFGSGKIGPYDLSYISITPTNSQKILTTGYLSKNGIILENQCSLQGSKTTDFSRITPWGARKDTVANVLVPEGFIIEYIVQSGDHYRFNLTSTGGVQNPDQIVYHRWVGTGTGGKVGEPDSSGLCVFEWLNPGEAVYTPPSS